MRWVQGSALQGFFCTLLVPVVLSSLCCQAPRRY
jgi:hypothetical protein